MIYNIFAGICLSFFPYIEKINLLTISFQQTILPVFINILFLVLSRIFFKTFFPHDYLAKTHVVQK